jgi:very-short-patch-repair endonuclease
VAGAAARTSERLALSPAASGRQHPVGPYILDFYCSAAHLAIEVDGLAHDNAARARQDERRRAWLAERGITTLRVRSDDVLKDEKLDGVLRAIKAAAPSSLRCSPPPPQAGEEPA